VIGLAGIGGALPPKKPLNRFVKWPKYVRIQRQKRVLCQRLKVPPALNQFTKALDKNSGASLTPHPLLRLRLPPHGTHLPTRLSRVGQQGECECEQAVSIDGDVCEEDPHTPHRGLWALLPSPLMARRLLQNPLLGS